MLSCQPWWRGMDCQLSLGLLSPIQIFHFITCVEHIAYFIHRCGCRRDNIHHMFITEWIIRLQEPDRPGHPSIMSCCHWLHSFMGSASLLSGPNRRDRRFIMRSVPKAQSHWLRPRFETQGSSSGVVPGPGYQVLRGPHIRRPKYDVY